MRKMVLSAALECSAFQQYIAARPGSSGVPPVVSPVSGSHFLGCSCRRARTGPRCTGSSVRTWHVDSALFCSLGMVARLGGVRRTVARQIAKGRCKVLTNYKVVRGGHLKAKKFAILRTHIAGDMRFFKPERRSSDWCLGSSYGRLL